ncbi:MAG: cell division protein ZipA C-terminal FtsZ-binding domain-containing protein, partial [Anaerolineales bacterium]|nr:cell division protein ZipA C-terminal FtsZ-binding domain-containing protein [Anaerolineales bacterium]
RSAGLKHGRYGIFHMHSNELDDEPMFSVASLTEPGSFDLVFNDIDKEGYPASLPIVAEKVRPGGVLIVDNMFLGGRVLKEGEGGPSVDGVRRFTSAITGDPDWVSSVIPIRDGLMLAYKIR